MISLTFDRTALALADLVITNNPHGTSLYLPEDGVVRPMFGTRYTRTPVSAYEDGNGDLLAAVREATDLPVIIYAQGADTAALETVKAELEAAVAQWSYDLTLTVDGAARTYSAEILLDVPWGPVDSGLVGAHLAVASFSIPLNP